MERKGRREGEMWHHLYAIASCTAAASGPIFFSWFHGFCSVVLHTQTTVFDNGVRLLQSSLRRYCFHQQANLERSQWLLCRHIVYFPAFATASIKEVTTYLWLIMKGKEFYEILQGSVTCSKHSLRMRVSSENKNEHSNSVFRCSMAWKTKV